MNVSVAKPDDADGRRRNGPRRRVNYERVCELAKLGWKDERIAADQNCHPGYVRLIRLGHVGVSTGGLSRKPSQDILGKQATMPAIDNPAILAARSLFFHDVQNPDDAENLFKSGFHNAKIGRVIQKGKWKGAEVYTLALEERATCPTSCQNWRSCYGNNMPHAHRFAHGPALEARIVRDVGLLCEKHAKVAIRLHTLGDFYSELYVDLWELLIKHNPNLFVFGFSARWRTDDDPVARSLVRLVMKRWDRFAIRFSDAPIDECSTVSIEHPVQKPADAVICPQQMNKTQACATCAFCWNSKKRVAFIKH